MVISVVDRPRSAVMIPMHWLSYGAPGRFLTGVSNIFVVERRDGPAMDVSLRTLRGGRPAMVGLRPECLHDD